MFFVIDKSKILSYLLASCTVVILFVAAAGLNNTKSTDINSVMTSINVVETNAVITDSNSINTTETNTIKAENNNNNSVNTIN